MTRIIIRATPLRSDYIDYLKKKLPDAEWAMCRNFLNRKMTGYVKVVKSMVNALAMAGSDAVVLMEEDIILTKDFRQKLEAVITEKPSSLIQFFCLRSADLSVGSRFDRSFMMTQCFYLPAGYAEQILEYYKTWSRNPECNECPGEKCGGGDTLIADFLRSRKEAYWIHAPSLVQHRVTVSMINPKRNPKRQSISFTDPDE